jgi:hypothetical protein
VTIDAIRYLTCADVHAAVSNFPTRYVSDWNQWLAVDARRRPELFGVILRRWQATRPQVMRRTRADHAHERPFLDDLLEEADGRVRRLGDLSVESLRHRTSDQESAMVGLWHVFKELAVTGAASSVGITKSVLLATNGRIGPALDSTVQQKIGVPRPTSAREWIGVLDGVAGDIAAYQAKNGPLGDCVPIQHRRLAVGRLYDMVLGPRALR